MNIKQLLGIEIKKNSLDNNIEIITIAGFGKAFGVNVDKLENVYKI